MVFSALAAAFASAEIVIDGGSRYVAVRLTPEIYNHTGADLSDLRIVSGGGFIPYFINSYNKNTWTDAVVYPMECINSYVARDDFYYDYALSKPQNGDVTATSMSFTTNNANFAKTLDVYGGYDNVHWEFVQTDNIYAVDGMKKLAIFFNKPCKYTHYRLKINNNLEKLVFNRVDLNYEERTIEETFFIETLVPDYTVENAGKTTRVAVEGLKHLRLCDITIESDAMFVRTVSVPGVTKEIYNLEFYDDTVVPMNRHVPDSESFVLTIDNGDDAPIDITGVTARYYADDLVFEQTEGRTYNLSFGGEAQAPVYDIERYKTDILSGEVGRAALGIITRPEKNPQTDYRMVFNAAAIVAAALLGAIIFIKLKNDK